MRQSNTQIMREVLLELQFSMRRKIFCTDFYPISTKAMASRPFGRDHNLEICEGSICRGVRWRDVVASLQPSSSEILWEAVEIFHLGSELRRSRACCQIAEQNLRPGLHQLGPECQERKCSPFVSSFLKFQNQYSVSHTCLLIPSDSHCLCRQEKYLSV